MKHTELTLLDCTLRDGGYYNNWNFSRTLIDEYLQAMSECGVDVVELGLRSLDNSCFKGACAFATDDFISSLSIPANLQVGIMINASELLGDVSLPEALELLFPNPAANSPVRVVRIACHVHEFSAALEAVSWLKQRGFRIGFNLMQIADRSEEEIKSLASEAANHDIDVLYFADSMGSMTPEQTAEIIGWLRVGWAGPLGIHTHDNLGLALSNTLAAVDHGASWVDATITGMGRGPGNARTEELIIEVAEIRQQRINMIPVMQLLKQHFKPMQETYGWGTNPYYYLTGKYGIHPSYVQQMLDDARFSEEDILAVIDHLRLEGGKKFSLKTLDAARHFYHSEASGSWQPKKAFVGREVLILGTGQGVGMHRDALERYIRKQNPVVLALNTQSAIYPELITYRLACHPVRLLADCHAHSRLPQPLITPFSMLPDQVRLALKGKEILDFGLQVIPGRFDVSAAECVLPTSLVMGYALAVATSGSASRILLAGFDGFGADDPRTQEVENLFVAYQQTRHALPLVAVTPSMYSISSKSIYAL